MPTSSAPSATSPTAQRSLAAAMGALRVFTGLVWLSNGLAKATDVHLVRWGSGFTFTLLTQGSARSIAARAAATTHLAPLGRFYDTVVLAHWGPFALLLTVSELAIGLGLVLGLASRLAALGGLLLITPIWVMLWPSQGYLWDYPWDLFALLLLALVPAGRVAGIDAAIARRGQARWPF